MFCDKCGTELAKGAAFCPNCGNRIKAKNKNIYVALLLTFILSGVGSIYAGNVKKGLILLAFRILFIVLGVFLSTFMFFSIFVWVYAFYEAYRDVQIANGHANPKLLKDYQGWDSNTKVIALVIVGIILLVAVAGCAGLFFADIYHSYSNTYHHSSGSGSNTHYYSSGSGSSYSSHSSHYGGVDTSPSTIARNDPDWYYDHYDYGDYDLIDNYLESQGYD